MGSFKIYDPSTATYSQGRTADTQGEPQQEDTGAGGGTGFQSVYSSPSLMLNDISQWMKKNWLGILVASIVVIALLSKRKSKAS